MIIVSSLRAHGHGFKHWVKYSLRIRIELVDSLGNNNMYKVSKQTPYLKFKYIMYCAERHSGFLILSVYLGLRDLKILSDRWQCFTYMTVQKKCKIQENKFILNIGMLFTTVIHLLYI